METAATSGAAPVTRASPAAPGERVASIDVLRGVAVLGILLMNVVGMGLPFGAYEDPAIVGNRSPADYWVWAVNAVLTEGKMRAIFSMLFGAGVVLIIKRVQSRDDGAAAADVHLRRNLWLMLFGVVHAYLLLWPGEILFTYAVAGLPLFAFRRLRPRTLIILGTLILALQTPKMVFHNLEVAEAVAGLRELEHATAAGGTLTPELQQTREGWLATVSGEKPTAAALQRAIDQRRRGYLANLSATAGSSLYVESTHLYKVGLWDALGPMLIGMALLELGVFSASRSYRFYAVMALAGYGIGIPLGIWSVADWTRHGFEAGARWVSLDEITRMSGGLGHVAMVMMVCKRQALTWVTTPLAAVGRMALTNYVMHTVICVTLFSGFGFGWFGLLARHQLYYVVAAIWAFQIIASPLWLRSFRFGPLEWLWRSLTYARRQPFRV